MPAETLFIGATLRERFVAAATRDDETAAQRLAPLLQGSEPPGVQRAEAWALLSAGVRWAAQALESAGVDGGDPRPVRDSEAAFERAQHLETKSWELSQTPGFHDSVSLLVDAVRRACYTGADLGPILGGRLGTFKDPNGSASVVGTVEPSPTDLQDIGSSIGEALRRYNGLGLGDIASEVAAVLRSGEAWAAGTSPATVGAAADSPPDEAMPHSETERVRLIALNMALSGLPRAKTEEHLREQLAIDEPQAILDEAYAQVHRPE